MDSSRIETARSTPIERVIEQRGIKLRGKIERAGACPRCGGEDRFSINVRKQNWNCRHCKPKDITGDAIGLVMWLDGVTFAKAVDTLAGEVGGPGRRDRQPHVGAGRRDDEALADEQAQLRKARGLWRSSVSPIGTAVETYLNKRGIAAPFPATVRFLAPLKPGHHPAMIVPFGMPDEPEPGLIKITDKAIAAVQLTLLMPDGSVKAEVKPNKITVASPAGMPMVLAPANDLLGLAITEGTEDALSVRKATGLGAWASGGASFMPKLAAAVPDYIDAVTIYAHDDKAGQRGARELADALVARGIEVLLEGTTL